MNLPTPFTSEYGLRRHIEKLLGQNKPPKQFLNFLGAGCYQHYVPAVCDEINSRGEFLTAYAGEPYDEHGYDGFQFSQAPDGRPRHRCKPGKCHGNLMFWTTSNTCPVGGPSLKAGKSGFSNCLSFMLVIWMVFALTACNLSGGDNFPADQNTTGQVKTERLYEAWYLCTLRLPKF